MTVWYLVRPYLDGTYHVLPAAVDQCITRNTLPQGEFGHHDREAVSGRETMKTLCIFLGLCTFLMVTPLVAARPGGRHRVPGVAISRADCHDQRYRQERNGQFATLIITGQSAGGYRRERFFFKMVLPMGMPWSRCRRGTDRVGRDRAVFMPTSRR